MSRSIPKVVALILVSLCLAWLLRLYDSTALAKINSMSPTEYIQRQRELHGHSYSMHILSCLVAGGFFLGVVEFVATVIERMVGKRT
jgi:hypothetical protein